MPVAEAPTILKGDIVELTFRGLLCGQTTLMVTHWKYNSEGAVIMNAALDALDTAVRVVGGLKDKYVAAAAANFSLVENVLQVVNPTRYARFVYPFTDVGTQATDASTADLAGVIVKSGWFAGDPGLHLKRGKVSVTHFPALPADKVIEGIIDGDYRSNFLGPLGDKLTQPIVDADGGEWLPVIFHAHAVPKSDSELSQRNVRPEARVMRRRTVGLGI